MNPDNARYKQYNHSLILIALSDGQWHRNMELKEQTKLTPRTLSKHLKELTNELQWIERKEDTESGEYPHPVLYRAKEDMLSIIIFITTVHYSYTTDNLERKLKETKDPIHVLIRIHELNLYYLTLLLEEMQKEKIMSQKEVNALLNFTIFAPYKIYISNLIDAFSKNIQFGTHFDIDKLRQEYNIWNGDINSINAKKIESVETDSKRISLWKVEMPKELK